MTKHKIVAVSIAALLAVINYCAYLIGLVPFVTMSIAVMAIGYAGIGYAVWRWLDYERPVRQRKLAETEAKE